MKNVTNQERDQIYNIYLENNSVSQTSIVSKRSIATVRRVLREKGVVFKDMGYGLFFTEDEKKQIIEEYQAGLSTVKIAEHFDKVKCDRTIASWLRRWGIELRESGQKPFIEHEDFFDKIDTEEKAYFLGILMADGSVMIDKKNCHCISFSLAEYDAYMVNKFIDAIGYNVTNKNMESIQDAKYVRIRPSIIRKNTEGHSDVYSVVMRSKKMFEALCSYGCVPNKTKFIRFPQNIPDNLLNHFVRGFFDGNGSVYSTKDQKCTKFSIYSQPAFLTELQIILEKQADLKPLSIHGDKNVSFVSWSKQSDNEKFYHYLYDNATIYLKRKKEKFVF